MYSIESSIGFWIHQINFSLCFFICMPIDMTFFFLVILFCCYSSYQIDCYNLLCSVINAENLNVIEDLKKLSKLHFHNLW